MKTYQLILAAAIVALASCNKIDVVDNNANLDSNEIGFTAVTKKATKANNAIITGTEYAHDNTFKVWGWQSQAADYSEFSANAESNFMSGLTIEWTTGRDNTRAEAWRNATNYYYWPFTGKIAFLAIHPSTVTPSTTGWDATNDVPQATIADYTITTENKTTDLLFANNEGQRRTDALPMVFKHALSQIVVYVKTDADYKTYDGVKFDVESVTFNNIDLSGDVAYGYNTTAAATVVSWTDNDTQSASWTYYNTVKEDILNYDLSTTEGKENALYGAANVMIPQPASVADDTATADVIEGTYLTVGYSMKQGSNAKITGTVNIPKPQLWEAGKKYNYTLNFRLNEIIFNPSVTEWVDVNVETINIF